MATPSATGSTPQPAATPAQRNQRKWIALLAGLIVVIAGVVLVWPKGVTEVPDDFCSFIGKETLAKYITDPRLRQTKIGPDLTQCAAVTPSRDSFLHIHLSRGEDTAESFDKLCRRQRSRVSEDQLIKPSETAEFGDRMCGWVDIQPRLKNASTVTIQHGDYQLFVQYGGGTGNRERQLQRTLDLVRVVFAKLG